jgi:hypothetical protein
VRDGLALLWMDAEGAPLALAALGLVAAAYYVRAETVDWIGIGANTGLTVWVGSAAVVAVAAAVAAYFFGLACWRYYQRKGYALPVWILIAVLGLMFYLPLPWTTEQRSFYEHRAAYQQLAELARQDRLTRSARCPAPGYEAPAGYEDYAVECILVDRDLGLVAEFTPRSIFRPVVYLDDPSVLLGTQACGLKGDAQSFLAPHWYVCRRQVDPLNRY